MHKRPSPVVELENLDRYLDDVETMDRGSGSLRGRWTISPAAVVDTADVAVSLADRDLPAEQASPDLPSSLPAEQQHVHFGEVPLVQLVGLCIPW